MSATPIEEIKAALTQKQRDDLAIIIVGLQKQSYVEGYKEALNWATLMSDDEATLKKIRRKIESMRDPNEGNPD